MKRRDIERALIIFKKSKEMGFRISLEPDSGLVKSIIACMELQVGKEQGNDDKKSLRMD